MADTEAPAQEPQAAKKKLPVKMMAVVAGIMVAEGAGVFLFVSMSARHPADAMAHIEGGAEADLEATVEIQLIEARFQNMSTNRLWRWEAVAFMKVRRKNEEHVNEIMTARSAEIQAGIAQIFRSAQHSHLKEPELKTLTRQLTAYVNEVFGEDPDGMPRVEQVMITSLNGLPIDV